MVLLACLWGLSLLRSSLVAFSICCSFFSFTSRTSSRTMDLLFLPSCFRERDLTMPFDFYRDLDLE